MESVVRAPPATLKFAPTITKTGADKEGRAPQEITPKSSLTKAREEIVNVVKAAMLNTLNTPLTYARAGADNVVNTAMP